MHMQYENRHSIKAAKRSSHVQEDVAGLTGIVVKEPDVPVLMSSDCDWKGRVTHDTIHLTPHWIICHHDK